MALIDFIKTVGHKLFDHTQTSSADDEQNAQKLAQHLQQLNLGIQNPVVKMQGDKVTIEGQASSQAVMEKAILAVGNVQGVAQVDAKVTTSQAQEPKFYTVKSGDTLSKIAKEEYGHANDYMKIFEANRPLLKDPNDIYPGQKLRVPQNVQQAA